MMIPPAIDRELARISGIPAGRVERLRRLVAVLREARALAVETDADSGGVLSRVEAALCRARRDADRAEAAQLAASVYATPEVQ